MEALRLIDHSNGESGFHEEFIHHLQMANDGDFYETRLPWKQDNLVLQNNKTLAKARLGSATRRLEKIGKLSEYNEVLQEHIKDRVLDKVPARPTGEVIRLHSTPDCNAGRSGIYKIEGSF